MTHDRRELLALAGASAVSLTLGLATPVAAAASLAAVNRDAGEALAQLRRTNSTANWLAPRARGVLIFPNIVKAGLMVGGSYGKGVLRLGNRVDGYYHSTAASFGLQAGAQSYGYVVFLMTQKAVKYIHDSQGWEIGVGPTVVVVDEGVARNLSTSTLKDDAYAFIFNQQGLMAGLSLEGTKISKIKG
ncbi:lipid-binding SYLF domain-containing protein [Caulobacter ginsengisoli]|uniref:Lipid-binding SYLF domain-containing protein n=1 Tax=Caulobacter ginsengisoli TaxID=400775 RepID=A0ABU0IT25_9CAUL|nr:lipid-binding SYLF domain-containing protein [Caulobacter ginsengisoli]MDQ0464189.1 lipid-binding SYLF domain-containing protein [Caulobacter ginsengisoli]